MVRELSGVDIVPLGELTSTDGAVDAIPCRIVKRSPGGVAGAEFVVQTENLAALWEVLLAAARRHGGGPMGYTALSGLRLAQGVPWFGYDFGEKQIPHEAGLQDSHISYTKGCYTGQEIVERVRSRGQVNRQRVSLVFSGDAVPEAGTPLTVDGKEVGFVTRAAKAWDAVPPRVLGMGYVRREAGTHRKCACSGRAGRRPSVRTFERLHVKWMGLYDRSRDPRRVLRWRGRGRRSGCWRRRGSCGCACP